MKNGRTRVYPATQERMELDTAVFGSAGKRRRSTEEKPGDGNRTMKDSNKKAKAQIGEAQEEIGGEVNESEVCERESGKGRGRETRSMECDDDDVVRRGEASGGGTGGGGRVE